MKSHLSMKWVCHLSQQFNYQNLLLAVDTSIYLEMFSVPGVEY